MEDKEEDNHHKLSNINPPRFYPPPIFLRTGNGSTLQPLPSHPNFLDIALQNNRKRNFMNKSQFRSIVSSNVFPNVFPNAMPTLKHEQDNNDNSNNCYSTLFPRVNHLMNSASTVVPKDETPYTGPIYKIYRPSTIGDLLQETLEELQQQYPEKFTDSFCEIIMQIFDEEITKALGKQPSRHVRIQVNIYNCNNIVITLIITLVFLCNDIDNNNVK